MGDSKPFRSDSALGKLPEERQDQIAQWVIDCKEGDRYEFARTQLQADGIKVSRTAVFNWFQGWRLRQRFGSAESFSLEVKELLKDPNLKLSMEQLDAAAQLAFTTKAVQLDDAEEFRQMKYLQLAERSAKTKAEQKDREIELSERRVTAMESKIAQASQELQKLRDPKSDLTDADRAAIVAKVDDILGIKKKT